MKHIYAIVHFVHFFAKDSLETKTMRLRGSTAYGLQPIKLVITHNQKIILHNISSQATQLNSPVDIDLDLLNFISPPPKPRLGPNSNHISHLQVPHKPAVARLFTPALVSPQLDRRFCARLDIISMRPRYHMVLPRSLGDLVAADGPFVLARQWM